MPLRLPEPGEHVLEIAVASGDINLIEGHVDGNSFDLALRLPVHF